MNTSILNEFITETIVNVSKTCAAKALNKLELGADTVGGNVVIGGEIRQTAAADLKCDQSSDLASAIKSELANTIKQSATSTDNSIITGDLGFYSETTANNNTVNRNIMKTSVDDVMNCLAEAKNEFKAHFGTVGGDFTFNPTAFDQTAKANVASCVQGTKWSQEIANKVANDVTQEAKNVGTLETLFGDAGRIMGTVMIILVVLGALSGMGFLGFQAWRKKKGLSMEQAVQEIVK